MLHRILIAEESPIMQKVVEGILEQEGFEFKTVSDCNQALQEIDSFNPHIVLASSDLHGLNGYELCKAIRNTNANPDIPVILLAGAYEPYNEEYAWVVGVDDYILKPFEASDLIGKIKKLLGIICYETYTPPLYPDDPPASKSPEAVSTSNSKIKKIIIIENTSSEIIEKEASSGTQKREIREPRVFIAPSSPLPDIVKKTTHSLPIIDKDIRNLLKQPLEDVLEYYLKSKLSEELLLSVKDRVSNILYEIAPKIIDELLRQRMAIITSSLTSEIESEVKKTLPQIVEKIIIKKLEKVD